MILNMNIAKEIVFVSHLLKRRVDNQTLKHGLTINQGRILMYLKEHQNEDVYQRDLENIIHLRRSSITVLLQKLDNDGYIERENVDAKKKILRISTSGLKKIDEIQNIFEENEKIIEDIVSDDKEIFYTLLNKIKKDLIQEDYDD